MLPSLWMTEVYSVHHPKRTFQPGLDSGLRLSHSYLGDITDFRSGVTVFIPSKNADVFLLPGRLKYEKTANY
jgi:hypothetical protein